MPYISLDQTGRAGSAPCAVFYKDDPGPTEPARRVLFRMAPNGIRVLGDTPCR